ncbi:MAG: tetratricopeptide repeat protein [Crocinitomicaceae bacterium]
MLENLSADNLKSEFKTNSKLRIITYTVSAVLVLVLGYFAYHLFIWKPANVKSTEAGYAGINYAAMDSTDLAIEELTPVVKKYDGKDGGEVAQFVLARQLMAKGEFKKALDNLEGVKVKDTYVRVYAIGLQGDCYSEMKQYDEAVEYYLKASKTDENDYTTPMYLFKAGLVTELKLNDPETAAEYYKTIKDNYLQYANQKTIDKYWMRASNKKVK